MVGSLNLEDAMDFSKMRAAMVDSQLRPNHIREARLIEAFGRTPRELFVPEGKKALAYMEAAIPFSVNKTARSLLAPMTLGKLLETAQPRATDKVLDIGGISGYSAAILSQVCKSVVALEMSYDFVDVTRKSLADASIEGVKVFAGS